MIYKAKDTKIKWERGEAQRASALTKFWEYLGFKIENSGNYVFGFAFITIETHFLCS